MASDSDKTIPLIEERLEVGTRVASRVVRIEKRVRERVETVDPLFTRESVQLRRVPVQRIVDAPPAVRTEGDVTIVPVLEEVPVVEKRLMLVEELHIERRHFETREPQQVTLRREAIAISTHSNPETKGHSMATSLVGVFDDHSDAQQAATRIVGTGIDRDAVEVTSGNTATMGDPTAISSSTSGRHGQHEGGIRGFFRSLFGADDGDDEHSGTYAEAVRRGNAVVTVNLADESRVGEVTDILEECGAIDVDDRVTKWQGAGYTGYDPEAPPLTDDELARERAGWGAGAIGATGTTGTQGERQNMQVVQEDLKVGKRQINRGGVRVHRRVSERPIEEQVRLREERAVIDRKAVDRPADPSDLKAFKDADVEIRETSEEPVVSKSARVVEEVNVGKEARERTEKVRDTVRRSDVEIEQLDGDRKSDSMAGTRGMPPPSSYRGPERRRSAGAYAGVERRAGF